MAVEEKYKGIVKKSMVSAAGLGVPGIFVPTLDTAGMTAIWTTMIGAIAKESGHKISATMIAKLVSGAVSGVSAYLLGSKILTWVAIPLILAFPIAGIPAVSGVNAFLNDLFTYRLGLTVSKQLSRADFTNRDFLGLS